LDAVLALRSAAGEDREDRDVDEGLDVPDETADFRPWALDVVREVVPPAKRRAFMLARGWAVFVCANQSG